MECFIRQPVICQLSMLKNWKLMYKNLYSMEGSSVMALRVKHRISWLNENLWNHTVSYSHRVSGDTEAPEFF